jgi:hypothetical protein
MKNPNWRNEQKLSTSKREVITQNIFHLIANGKHRIKRIFQLEQEEETIIGQDNIKCYITNFYMKLFGKPEVNSFTLDEKMVGDSPQISPEEN